MRCARWLAVVVVLAGLAGCGSRQPGPRPRPRDAERKESGKFEVGSRGTVDIPGADGRTALTVTGTARGTLSPEASYAQIADASLVSRVPDYESTCTVGRVQFRLGETEVQLRNRLALDAPKRKAKLRAERATLDVKAHTVAVEGPSRLVYDGTVFDAAHLSAALDLRSARGRGITARREADGELWTAAAETLEGEAASGLILSKVKGEMSRGGQTLAFEAPRAAWHQSARQLNFEEGAVLRSGEMTLKAEGATFLADEHRVVARGTVTATSGGMTVTGVGGSVDLVDRIARLNELQASAGKATLHAEQGELHADRSLALHGVRVDMANGATLTAGNATWQPDSQALTARDGVRASKGGRTVTAAEATWHAGGDLVASGGVRLSADGLWATGPKLTAAADLSRASLSPVRAGGDRNGSHWSLTAERGEWTADGGLTLMAASGEFRGKQHVSTARAGTVTYAGGGGTLVFTGGFHAEYEERFLVVDSDSARYDPQTKAFEANGHVRARSHGILVQGPQWKYKLDDSNVEGEGGGSEEPRKDPAGTAAKR